MCSDLPRFLAPLAEEQLATIVRNLSDHSAVVSAARLIDVQLARDPFEIGESRFDAVRVGFELPLGIHYEVLQDVRTIIVYDVWWIDRTLK